MKKKRTIYTHSQSGSALIQAMLGLGLVGIMSYSVMNYQAYSNQENRAQFAQNEIDSTAQMVSALVAIPALCNSNVSLQNNFVRPANLNNPAADAHLAINLGLPTSARPAWVDGTMGAAAGTSIPGTITDFNIQVHSIFVSGARLKRNVSATNQLWVGDIVLTAQKPRLNPNDGPATTGKRIVGTIELEIDAAGTKVNCSTSASVATICRDLGGVYDPLGVPNCVFAMKPMDCDSLPDGYVHDIDGSGNPVCRSATAVCPTGYFANGMTEGALNCTRLSRRIIYQAAPATPSPGPSTPTDCSSAAMNWTVGANSCSATAPATLHMASANVTDSIADATGAATFTCNNGVWSSTPQPGATCTTPPVAPACVKVFLYSACKKAGGKTACGYASPHYLYPELACSGNIIAGGYMGPQGISPWKGVGEIAQDGWSIPALKSYPTAKCVVHYKIGYSTAGAHAMESIYYDGPAQPGALTTGKVNSVGEALIKKVDSCP